MKKYIFFTIMLTTLQTTYGQMPTYEDVVQYAEKEYMELFFDEIDTLNITSLQHIYVYERSFTRDRFGNIFICFDEWRRIFIYASKKHIELINHEAGYHYGWDSNGNVIYIGHTHANGVWCERLEGHILSSDIEIINQAFWEQLKY